MLSLIRKRMKGDKGFTLIELLVVIIIIAILAAIAIPTFLSQRTKAQDAAAKSLVRNAMMSIESAYVDTRAFNSAEIDDAYLEAGEPSIDFNTGATSGTLAGPAVIANADAQQNQVLWNAIDASSYEAGTQSQSGKYFGIVVDKSAGGGNEFYIDGDLQTTDAW